MEGAHLVTGVAFTAASRLPPLVAQVTHTEKGLETLSNFFLKVCGLKASWSMDNVLDEQLARMAEQIGPDDHAICALSGGVDSAVAATLVHKVIGDRLHCCFVDNGLLRCALWPQGSIRT